MKRVDDVKSDDFGTRLHIGTGQLDRAPRLLSEQFNGRQFRIVADENTYDAAGRYVFAALERDGIDVLDPIIYSSSPQLYADNLQAQALEDELRVSDAVPVAVGSGTINDLCKVASHRLGLSYACIPTAASMDGYSATGAAITVDGFKQTIACPAPDLVIADLDVLASAPKYLTASGYGDLLGKVTAGADWIVADALRIEPIQPVAWSLVQDSLFDWIDRPAQLARGDIGAVGNLFQGLIATGRAMQAYGNSRPASGAEHLFSHLWEMHSHPSPSQTHGFKVGIGTLAVAALYERVLDRDFATLDVDGICEAWPSASEVESRTVESHQDTRLAERARVASLDKYVSAAEARTRLVRLQTVWPSLRRRLSRQLLPPTELRRLLELAGCPIELTAIGLELAQVKEAYHLARTIRSRYTVLDLASDCGILSECVDALFSQGGFWS